VRAVIVAIASSFPLGISLGVLCASRAHGKIRPCRALQAHRRVAGWSAGAIAVASALAAAVATLEVKYQRPALALICAVVALVHGFAAWLLLVEADDDYRNETPDEPEWWPAFERELEAWRRNMRVPVR
jgi:hypothetical protein